MIRKYIKNFESGKNMKKLIILSLLVTLSVCGCSKGGRTKESLKESVKESAVEIVKDTSKKEKEDIKKASESSNIEVEEEVDLYGYGTSKEDAREILYKAYENLKNSNKNFTLWNITCEDSKENLDKLRDADNIQFFTENPSNTGDHLESDLIFMNSDEAYVVHAITNGTGEVDNIKKGIDGDKSFVEYYKTFNNNYAFMTCEFNQKDYSIKDLDLINRDKKNIIEVLLESDRINFGKALNNGDIEITSAVESDGYYEIGVRTSDNKKYLFAIEDNVIYTVVEIGENTHTLYTIINEDDYAGFNTMLITIGLYSEAADNPISDEALKRLENEFLNKSQEIKDMWELSKKSQLGN